MTEEELKIQRVRARAELSKLKRLKDSGNVAVMEKITAAQEIVDSFVNFPAEKITTHQPEFTPTPADAPAAAELTDEQKAILQALRDELTAIDKEKNRKINALSELDRNVNHYQRVQDIKQLREKWTNKSDEIYFFLTHGKLMSSVAIDSAQASEEVTDPDNQDFESSEFFKALPRDLKILNTKLKNTETYISKAQTGIKTAKSVEKELHYKQREARFKMEWKMIDYLIGML